MGGIRHYLLKITGAVNKHSFSKARSPYSWGFSPPGFCDQEHYDKGNLDMASYRGLPAGFKPYSPIVRIGTPAPIGDKITILLHNYKRFYIIQSS